MVTLIFPWNSLGSLCYAISEYSFYMILKVLARNECEYSISYIMSLRE